MPVDPVDLLLLERVRELGSLSAAARALGVTPAAATGRLARFERRTGVTLVVRGPRGARLTEPGYVLAEQGRLVAGACARADKMLGEAGARARRSLRVGAFQAAGQHLLPPALTALRRQHEGVDLSIHEISSSHGTAKVAQGELDIAVISVWDLADVSALGVQPFRLLADPMIVCLPDDHPKVLDGSAFAGLTLHDLRDEHWILINPGHAARSQIDRAASAAGFTPRLAFETASYHVAQSLVGTGIGVAVLSRLTAYRTAGAVHVQLDHDLHRDIYALLPADNVSDPARALLALLEDTCADLAEQWRNERASTSGIGTVSNSVEGAPQGGRC